MQSLFGYIGYVFGYILWFFYELVKNYGVAIILFTIVLKIIMFPFSVKQQKSMAKNSIIAAKRNEITKRYENDKNKLNEELAKLYEKEGISPFGGCFTMFVPLLLALGVYWAVIMPLTNTVHISPEHISGGLSTLQAVPGVGNIFSDSRYGEIMLVKYFSDFKEYLTMFTPAELANLEFFSKGFKFLGLDLLGTPSLSSFSSMLWIIPVLCFFSSVLTQVITQKISGNNAMQAQQGCMKVMIYGFPLITAYFAYNVPAAVGFYWIISTLIQFLQTLVLNHFYSAGSMIAKEEAARVTLRELEEKNVGMIG